MPVQYATRSRNAPSLGVMSRYETPEALGPSTIIDRTGAGGLAAFQGHGIHRVGVVGDRADRISGPEWMVMLCEDLGTLGANTGCAVPLPAACAASASVRP